MGFNFGSVGSAFASAADFASQVYSNEFNSDEASFARNWSADQAGVTRDWQERMRGTQYQTAVKDLEAAGLNPMLAYMHGGAGTPAGATGQSSVASAAGVSRPSESMQRSSAMDVMSAQAENVRADTRVKEATENEIRARTPTYGVNIDRLRQDILESQQKVRLMEAQGGHAQASADQARQQTENLKALMPQISATVDQLRSLTRVNDARIGQIAAEIGKTKAETSEIIQRVKENLPKIEGMLKDMEFAIAQSKVAGAQREGEVRGIPVLGHAAALVKMFNPFVGLFGGN